MRVSILLRVFLGRIPNREKNLSSRICRKCSFDRGAVQGFRDFEMDLVDRKIWLKYIYLGSIFFGDPKFLIFKGSFNDLQDRCLLDRF